MSGSVDERRIRELNDKPISSGPVVYWMSRDQRIEDNWALLHAQELALQTKQPLVAAFCLVPKFLGATIRQYDFMLTGLEELNAGLEKYNIAFYLAKGEPEQEMPRICKKLKAGALITDFNPLRITRHWKKAVAEKLNIAVKEVDAHNIVPCWIASTKQEYAAYTIRPKINRLLPDFFTDIPRVVKHPYGVSPEIQHIDWLEAKKLPALDRTVSAVPGFTPGEKAAFKAMGRFISKGLARYDEYRNDPTKSGQSGLSPYLHFGQLSAQRLAYEARQAEEPGVYAAPFLEELIVRRELSDNYCCYNENYDSVRGFPRWALETLEAHRDDPREYIYPLEIFEAAETHDELWNAAQKEMMATGKMHGYMRMYWAKKILEWTESPEEAMEVAIYLNDRYSLDGRDPNGYAGIAWCIGGVHDRAWGERPIFGKIRYMSYKGSKSKFNIKNYVKMVNLKAETTRV